ncbi:MAG: hypothetical protein ACI4J2_11440 [Ruminococcus sp.]
MNYNKILYDVTAMLLLLQSQMKEYSYSVVVSRYLYECGFPRARDTEYAAVEAIAILLSLERNGVPMPNKMMDELEKCIHCIDGEFISAYIPNVDKTQFEEDLDTVKTVIHWYRTTEGKLT